MGRLEIKWFIKQRLQKGKDDNETTAAVSDKAQLRYSLQAEVKTGVTRMRYSATMQLVLTTKIQVRITDVNDGED